MLMQPIVSRPHLPADGAIDLQLHTIYSDGTWTPPQLLDYLVSEQFSLAAITDHERTDTAETLHQLATERQFPLVVAAEISASWRGEPTDVLCYGFEVEKGRLHEVATDIARRQIENTGHVCANLAKMGITLPQEEQEGLLTQPSSQQPQALVDLLRQHGYGRGDPSAVDLIVDAGFYFETSDIAAVVEATHHSGGVCLIAHPGRGGEYVRFDAQMLDELREQVPIDGLEVYYPAHTPEQIAMYRDYAQAHRLLTSSGSDSHGPEKKPIKYRAEWSSALLERLGFQIQ
jgi:3',5'-nucleoside bisphosphate phosphatase